MDSGILSTLSFIWAFNKVKPAQVVDKLIEIVVKVLTPGRGIGEDSWLARRLRSIEQIGEKAQRELQIRDNLRQWDVEFPYLHHELIIRYMAGFLASTMILSLYNTIRYFKQRRFY